MSPIRLQKYLSERGVASRRKAEEYILKGLVKVNGEVVSKLGSKIDPISDQVEFSGEIITDREKMLYIIINKPKGVVTTCAQKDEIAVVSLMKDIPERVFPVGRLDKDSTGLLLLTNDGVLSYRLTHPKFGHEKEYQVTLFNPISDGALKKMSVGLPIFGKKTQPAEIVRLSARRFNIILKEGRNRQIRRMVRKVGSGVKELKRIRLENLKLGKLLPGQYRSLTEKEKLILFQRVGLR